MYLVVARHANYDTVRSDNFNLNEGLNIRYIQVDFEPPRGDAAIQNPANEQTYNFLKSKRFRLGIAEIDQSSGFALFQQLGIKNMIATSNTPVISPYYHLLGMPMPYEVPEQFTAQPDDGFANSQIRRRGSHRQNENMNEIRRLINIYKQEYENEFFQQNSLPPLWQIIANIRYLFINHTQIAAYPRPINQKIKFIGGIDIQQQYRAMFYSKIMTNNAIQRVWAWDFNHLNESNCVVIFTIGTVVTFLGITQYQLISIFNAFAQHENCYFFIRADHHIERYVSNGSVQVPQNALYAGVPVICIPFFGDQRYNASVVEYLNLGMWVSAPNLENEFQIAVNNLLDESNQYLARANEFAVRLHTQNQENSPEQIFISAVRNVINTNVSFADRVQVGEPRFVHQK
uniref:glucuronosyltransferase n=1 Tax=Meloidogyne javanica TaxID=6303 RepID=A0A915M6L6_MELJA